MTRNLGPFLGRIGKDGRSDWIRTSDPYPPRIDDALISSGYKPLSERMITHRSRLVAVNHGPILGEGASSARIQTHAYLLGNSARLGELRPVETISAFSASPKPGAA